MSLFNLKTQHKLLPGDSDSYLAGRGIQNNNKTSFYFPPPPFEMFNVA